MDVTVECDVVPTAPTLTAIDNCGTAAVTFEETQTNGTCASDYVITRTWTATDECGLTTVHTQTVTVQDTTAPTFVEALPADITVECDVVPTVPTLTATDNCGTVAVTFEETQVNGDCSSNYILTRTWTATDECGLTTVHIQIITVQDTTAPDLITDLEDVITVNCSEIPEVPELVFEDACSTNMSVEFNETSTNTGDATDYIIIREWTVTDDCGNQAIYAQTINVTLEGSITSFDTALCIEDLPFDLFNLLSGDYETNGTWEVVSGVATLDGSIFDPSTVELGDYVFQYNVTQSDCPSETQVTINVHDDCVVLPCGEEDVIISTTLTPNGDQWNEYFTVTGVEDCGFVVELQIFNRWGAKIYENFNYQNDWNGFASKASIGGSDKVPTGTYYYVINLRNSGLKPFAGPIYVATK